MDKENTIKIEELQKGYKMYDVNSTQVIWYTYLCVHPASDMYHILIDMNEEPIRIWKHMLQDILDNNLTSYEKARLYLADKLEQRVIFLRTTKDGVKS
jgi:hypothetical protein